MVGCMNNCYITVLVVACIVASGCTSYESKLSKENQIETIIEPPTTTIVATQTTEQPPTVTPTILFPNNRFEAAGNRALVLEKCMQGIGTKSDCARIGVVLDRDNGNMVNYNFTATRLYVDYGAYV